MLGGFLSIRLALGFIGLSRVGFGKYRTGSPENLLNPSPKSTETSRINERRPTLRNLNPQLGGLWNPGNPINPKPGSLLAAFFYISVIINAQ